jgi:hypothetical protein
MWGTDPVKSKQECLINYDWVLINPLGLRVNTDPEAVNLVYNY